MARRASYSDSDEDEIISTSLGKQKVEIGQKQWITSFKYNNSNVVQKYIMSFLLNEGLYDVAKKFNEQSGTPMSKVDQVVIKERYQIKQMIRKGQIEQALAKINAIDPSFQAGNKNAQLLFSLKCLKVINLIKQGYIQQSIETAKNELLPFTKKGQKFIKDTEKVMGLLAFVNLKQCPNKQLVNDRHASTVASKINRHLLDINGHEQTEPALQQLLKIGKWCENRLSQFISFPKINLESSDDNNLFTMPST